MIAHLLRLDYFVSRDSIPLSSHLLSKQQTSVPLCLCASVPLCLCASVPLCLCASVPLCLCALVVSERS